MLNISMMKVLMWTLSIFLALFHNSCLKQHRDMFNLICVLHTETPARSGCCFVGGLGSLNFYVTRAVCIQSGSCYLQHGSMFPVVPCSSGIMTKETAETDGLPGICHEKAVQSPLPTCCDAGSHFQSRDAYREDHQHSEELSYLCKFLFNPL